PSVRAADCLAEGLGLDNLHAADRTAVGKDRAAAVRWIAGDGGGRAVKVLVTGATGFTGGHLARDLARRGYAVRALVRKSADAVALHADGIDPVVGALEQTQALAQAVEGVDVVYHIAAIYRQAGVSGDRYRIVNVDAVKNLIEAAASAGARRFVHCSTVGVHGDVEHPPANEDAPLNPGDVYQRTKLQGERVARETAAARQLELTIA